MHELRVTDTIVQCTAVSAFCLKDEAGVLPLKKLSDTCIIYVRLLPNFQFAGVDDILVIMCLYI
ncbi:hypothetical protein NC651_009210 [Populus alba x Populus x berolinensis]|nr:hypothetical protein NC651_009210 [Populus alba x Populus x berolinensis]